MNKEKQIEDIANIINEMPEPNAHYYDETLQDHEAFADCFTIARYLYNAGYRKASDVAREIFEQVGELINEYLDGRSYRHEFLTKIAELKKKYAESENNDG